MLLVSSGSWKYAAALPGMTYRQHSPCQQPNKADSIYHKSQGSCKGRLYFDGCPQHTN